MNRPRVGVSACVLGEPVRFDGGHKRSHFVQKELGDLVDFIPVCPEKEIGMGVPRPVLRLLRGDDGEIQMVESDSGIDHSEAMTAWSKERANGLDSENLDGFVLQAKSPSCGMERVKTYRSNGMLHDTHGVGLFARALMDRFPLLVVEEAPRLNDMRLRDNFCFRLFAMRRAKDLFAGNWRNGDVIAFHTREKMALLARGRPAYEEIGRLVSGVASVPREDFARDYLRQLALAFRPVPTRGRLLDALQHLAGHFKEDLLPAEKEEFLECMKEFQAGRLPLHAIARMMRLMAARHGRDWVADQTLLNPAPNTLGLHNTPF
ncbi:MAG: YbgA family protein [Planctomycetota bacterium]